MTKRLAILGAGPIGIEAATLAMQQGFDVTVFERGAIGSHVSRWGQVRLFSPWKLNRSPWGEATLRENGVELADGEDFPTGHEYLRDYLYPLSNSGLVQAIRPLTRVVGVARRDGWKGQLIGKRAEAGPFIISVRGPEGPSTVEADVVLDATGVYSQPVDFGPGGLPVNGEDTVDDLISHWIPDVLGRDRELYADRHTLLVGNGYSAATTLRLLVDLRESAPETTVTWLVGDLAPYVELPDDPLPQRLELAGFGNAGAAGELDGVTAVRSAIAGLVRAGSRVSVRLQDQSCFEVDRIVANVGYRPDVSITRELQVHHCYASEGPMKLAATLLAQDGNSDCLAQESAGIDTLRSPESDFWVVGGKSYGRNSNFLLRVGFEQIETILAQY